MVAAIKLPATFKVVEAGSVHFWSQSTLEYDEEDDFDYDTGKLCSQSSQLFELLVGAFSVERAFKTIEVGLQSNVGLRSSGITNFNSLVAEESYEGGLGDPGEEKIKDDSYQAYINAEFCGGQNDEDDAESEAYRKEILPGTYSAADTRYSFFRILYRDIDSDSPDFTASTNLYGIRSVTGVDVYNFIRFKFNRSKRREFRFVPISSWEIRSNQATGALYAIDAHSETDQSIDERQDLIDEDKRFTVEFVGEEITNRAEAFSVKAFKPPAAIEREECESYEGIRDVRITNGAVDTLQRVESIPLMNQELFTEITTT